MSNVVELGAHANMSVEEALSIVTREALSDVIVVGYDEEGEVVVRSSHMSRQEAVYLLLEAVDWARGK